MHTNHQRTKALIAFLAILSPAIGCYHPFTKIGAIGYENSGFEKTIDLTGRITTDEQGKPNGIWIDRLHVTNDASRAYAMETERLNVITNAILQALREILPLFTNQPPAPTSQPTATFLQSLAH